MHPHNSGRDGSGNIKNIVFRKFLFRITAINTPKQLIWFTKTLNTVSFPYLPNYILLKESDHIKEYTPICDTI